MTSASDVIRVAITIFTSHNPLFMITTLLLRINHYFTNSHKYEGLRLVLRLLRRGMCWVCTTSLKRTLGFVRAAITSQLLAAFWSVRTDSAVLSGTGPSLARASDEKTTGP